MHFHIGNLTGTVTFKRQSKQRTIYRYKKDFTEIIRDSVGLTAKPVLFFAIRWGE